MVRDISANRTILLILLGLWGQSGCHWRTAKQVDPRQVEECRQFTYRGISASEKKQWDEAEQLFARAVESCPLDAEAHARRAEALWNLARRNEALSEIEEAMHLGQGEPGPMIQSAQMRFVIGDIETARKQVEWALDVNPDLVEGWLLHARILSRQGDLSQALADYHRVAEKTAHDDQVLLEIAELYRRQGRHQRALANLREILDYYSPGEEPADVLYQCGLAYSAMQRYPEAIDSFQSALNRGGTHEEVLYRLGESQLLAHRYEDARQTFSQVLTLNPTHAKCLELLAQIPAKTPGKENLGYR